MVQQDSEQEPAEADGKGSIDPELAAGAARTNLRSDESAFRAQEELRWLQYTSCCACTKPTDVEAHATFQVSAYAFLVCTGGLQGFCQQILCANA